MYVYRCQKCQRAARPDTLQTTIDPRWRRGTCLTCQKERIFIRHGEPEEGERLKEDGIHRADQHASEGVDMAWRIAARTAALRLANSGMEFTQDDITNVVGLPTIRNATGALLSGMAKQHLIERVGDTTGSRDSQHSRRISVWKGRA